MVLTEAERLMLEAFRLLPKEIREALDKTIQSQADYYKPGRTRCASQPQLLLVVGGRRG